MKNNPHYLVHEIFDAACEFESKKERHVFLNNKCGDNQALRNQVESLIQAFSNSDSLLEPDFEWSGAFEFFDATKSTPLTTKVESHLSSPVVGAELECDSASFSLLEKLGEGGYGLSLIHI